MLILPLAGTPRTTQHYGERPDYYAQFGLRGHNGIDYSAPIGTPVLCAADGLVAYVDTDRTGYGDYIRVWHPALRLHSFYAHLSAQLVKRGDAVKQGQVIGRTGNSGNSTGPHLHWELRLADAHGNYLAVDRMGNGSVDPVSFLAGLDRGGEPFVPARYEPTPEFLKAMPFVLEQEGGWADNPADPGGATMRGITLATYTRWRAGQGLPAPTKDDLKAISDDELQQIYLGDYWLACGAQQLEWPLSLAHYDAAVNSGVGQAAKFLEQSGGDFAEYMGLRVAWYTDTKNWETFGRGWIRRCAALLKAAA